MRVTRSHDDDDGHHIRAKRHNSQGVLPKNKTWMLSMFDHTEGFRISQSSPNCWSAALITRCWRTSTASTCETFCRVCDRPTTTIVRVGMFCRQHASATREITMTVKSHVTRPVAGCFAVLRQLHSTRCSMLYISTPFFSRWAFSHVAGLRKSGACRPPAFPDIVDCDQSIVNAAARLVHEAGSFQRGQFG